MELGGFVDREIRKNDGEDLPVAGEAGLASSLDSGNQGEKRRGAHEEQCGEEGGDVRFAVQIEGRSEASEVSMAETIAADLHAQIAEKERDRDREEPSGHSARGHLDARA